MNEPGCGATIEAVWQQVGADPRGEKVRKNIDNYGKRLTKWSKTCFQNVIKELEKNLPKPRN